MGVELSKSDDSWPQSGPRTTLSSMPLEKPPSPQAREPLSVAQRTRWGLGLALLALSYLPLHRLLAPRETGPAGEQTRAAAEAAWVSGMLGTGLVLVLALLLARVVASDFLEARLTAAGRRLVHAPATTFSVGVALLALLQCALIAWAVHGGRPTSVDEMVQLLHARALLNGAITLPLSGPAPAWSVLNGVVTESGWASVYPPLHTAWLAAWLWVGAAWLAGPVATAAAVGATAWCADALLEDRAAARAAGILLAFTPFFLLLGGTHLSHGTTAALLAGVLLTAILARDRGWIWAVAVGAAMGAAVCARPWTGLVISTVLVAGVWIPRARREGSSWAAGRVGGVVLGGVPFAALLCWWNATLFGHPLRLGYSVAFGPAHGLGFHRDPWGNRYGLLEAIGYTGADLVQLGAHLLETPLPALALVGTGLMLGRRWRRGESARARQSAFGGAGVFLAWGIAGVAANAAYWHHGVHMGPRLLFETAPAWVVLWVLMAVELARPDGRLPPFARRTAMWVAILSLSGGAVLTPGVIRAYRASPGEAVAASLPTVPAGEQALVFVHGSWASRVANRLAALGMRRDSVETALRQNDLCAVDRFARARAAGQAAPVSLSLEPRPGTPSHLQGRSLSRGNTVRVDPGLAWDAGCVREARADRLGSLELEPLAWQTSPGTSPLMVVRDLGPSLNARVMEAYPDRRAWFWIANDGGQEPALLPYDEGAELLWGGAAGVSLAVGES